MRGADLSSSRRPGQQGCSRKSTGSRWCGPARSRTRSGSPQQARCPIRTNRRHQAPTGVGRSLLVDPMGTVRMDLGSGPAVVGSASSTRDDRAGQVRASVAAAPPPRRLCPRGRNCQRLRRAPPRRVAAADRASAPTAGQPCAAAPDSLDSSRGGTRPAMLRCRRHAQIATAAITTTASAIASPAPTVRSTTDVGRASQVAEQAVPDAPDDAADQVVDREYPVGHLRGTGRRRHQCAHDRDEAPAKNGQPASLPQRRSGPVERARHPAQPPRR